MRKCKKKDFFFFSFSFFSRLKCRSLARHELIRLTINPSAPLFFYLMQISFRDIFSLGSVFTVFWLDEGKNNVKVQKDLELKVFFSAHCLNIWLIIRQRWRTRRFVCVRNQFFFNCILLHSRMIFFSLNKHLIVSWNSVSYSFAAI
jgi:hypothetical protein